MKRTLVAIALTIAAIPVAAQRLPRTVFPSHYDLTFAPDFKTDRFDGDESITVTIQQPLTEVVIHAKEIEFKKVTIESGGITQDATVTIDEKREEATLKVAKPLAIGPATIRIRFVGILNNQLRGLYVGKTATRKYAATQMEATDARTAFPSFDEPEMKATFSIAATVDTGDVAFSNGAVISDTPGPGAGKHTLRFATTPRMSTYLVALVVGDFKCLETKSGDTPIRVCAAPDKVHLGQFALEASKSFLDYFNTYYSIKYPFGKLDHIAIPDFRAGAMENVGAVIYRETALLTDPKVATDGTLRGIASVISHETAHMWFGDIVTMRWWDDIWLNEGFASWMQSKPLDAWMPEWKMKIREAEATGGPMGVDVLKTTRQIKSKASTPAEIDELFDGIAYGKAAAMLRMIEAYVGEETFRKGVNQYLEQHAWGNATSDDFSEALSTTSGKPVDRILGSFVKQPGVPMVSVATRCENGKSVVDLSQQRFFGDPTTYRAANDQRWSVPVCFSRGDGKPMQCELLSEKKQTVTLDGCGGPVFANANGRGYYLTSYSADARAQLTKNMSSLTPSERAALTRDEWYLVRVGERKIGDYLNVVAALKNERERTVLQGPIGNFFNIDRNVVSAADQPKFRSWVREMLTPIVNDLGWTPKAGEDSDRKAVRASAIAMLGYVGRDEKVIKQARTLAESYLKNPASVDPSMAETVLALAAENGDVALYEKFLAARKAAKTPEEESRFLYLLTSFDDPKLTERTLKYAMSGEVRAQDAPFLMSATMNAPSGKKVAWDFVKANWADIEKQVPERMRGTFINGAAADCTEERRKDIEAFFKEHPIPSAARGLTQTLERMNSCLELRRLQSDNLHDWLATK
jgi:aminopeptidase N